MAPDVIAGRYRVERAIGQGGMGTVWLCHDDVLGRQVAVKQVGLLPGEDRLDVARALREARSSAVLNHRNVVAVYDAVDEGEQIWLVMEYVRGRTLAELVAEQGPLPPVRAAWIGAQVADGLAAAHARGTVHRDVKPGNILVGDDDLAKISDFGIARTHGDSQITQSGVISGTPAFFAPEVARGGESGPAADVWSLGATLYAAVEGRLLFEDEGNALALVAKIASSPPPSPANAGILTEPIRRMLDPDPASRWSMVDVEHVLHRLHQRHSPAAPRTRTITSPMAPTATAEPDAEPDPESDPEPTTRTEPAPSTPPPVAAPEQGSPAEPSTGRRRRPVVLLATLVSALALAGLAGFFLLGGGNDPSSGSETGASGQGKPSAQPGGGASVSPTETPSSSSSSSSPSPSTEASTTAQPTSGSAGQFAAGYYGLLPDDTSAAWQDLSPSFRSSVGGRGSYDGFWSTISGVTVNSVKDAGSNAVDVSLTYAKDDGSSESEVRRLYLEPSHGSYLIVDDEVVG